jgi:hypothetical protein
MGNKRAIALTLVLIMAAVSLFLSGCAKESAKGLKDEDAIKAVTTTLEGNTKGFKLSSPITIVERGAKNPAGEFLYKVEYTITLADGSSKKEAMTYKISSGGINDMGVPQWNAMEAK